MEKYSIQVYGYNFSSVLTTLTFGYDFYNFEYKIEVSKAGGAKFTMEAKNLKATPTNLKMYNRVVIYKGTVPKFVGYIEKLDVTLNEISIECIGLLGLFKKRLHSGTFNSTTAQAAFYSILTTLNAANDTEVEAGEVDVNLSIDELEFIRTQVFSAWDKLASQAEAEYQIRPALDVSGNLHFYLDFKYQLGSDKTDSVYLRYLSSQINSATIVDFQVEVDGGDIVNKVTGVTKNGAGSTLTSTQQDAASIVEFGQLEDTVSFSETLSQTDLDTETAAHVNQHKDEIYTPKIAIDLVKIDESNISLGDLVRVDLNNGFVVLSENNRVLRKTIKLSQNGNEEITVTIQPEGANLLPSSFFSSIVDIENRVRQLESTS